MVRIAGSLPRQPPILLIPLDTFSRGNDRRAIEAHLAELGVQPGDVGIAHIIHRPGCALECGRDCDCDVRVVSGPPMNRAARRRAVRERRKV